MVHLKRLLLLARKRRTKSEDPMPEWIWCLVANVRDSSRPVVMPEKERRGGCKHFAAGTRVYVYYQNWCTAERCAVLGKKKGTHEYIRKYINPDVLTNFRLKKVYSPTVISWMCGPRSRTIRNYSSELDVGRWGDLLQSGGNTDEDRRLILEYVRDLRSFERDPVAYEKAAEEQVARYIEELRAQA